MENFLPFHILEGWHCQPNNTWQSNLPLVDAYQSHWDICPLLYQVMPTPNKIAR